MTDHPSTFNAEDTYSGGIDWNNHATIHRASDGQGLFGAMTALHRGTLAEMVAMVVNLPEFEREKLVIQKAGDHRLGLGEIMALARRPDFPRQ